MAGERNDLMVTEVGPGAMEALSRSEIMLQVDVARKYPRSIDRAARNMVSMATTDEDTATRMFYSLSRDGKAIQGPSVRLAEIAVTCWGNARVGARVLEIGDRYVTAQAMAMDTECNVVAVVEVRRPIVSKKHGRYSDDMIAMTCNAACAIVYRNAAFKIVPRAYIDRAYEAAKRQCTGDAKKLPERRAKAIARFGDLKPAVLPVDLLKYLDRQSIEHITAEDLQKLLGVYTAIGDGETTIEEEFGIVAPDAPAPAAVAATPAAPVNAAAPVQAAVTQPPATAPTTAKQRFQTLSLQITALGKDEITAGVVAEYEGIIGNPKKDWNDEDYANVNAELAKKLEAANG